MIFISNFITKLCKQTFLVKGNQINEIEIQQQIDPYKPQNKYKKKQK